MASPAMGSASASTAPAFTTFVAPGNLGNSAGEPSIGLNPATGNVMFQSGAQTLRVTFDDSVTPATATWANVASLQTSFLNIDPILFTDQGSTPPRTYAGGLEGDCSVLAYTDDDGASWAPMTNACASPAYDHETIGSGPWFNGVPPAGAFHPRAVYYCAQEIVEQCAVSRDGGITFGPGVPINPNLDCSGLLGHVKVGADGTAYVPAKNCVDSSGRGVAGFFLTRNNGLTWGFRAIAPSDRPANGFDPSLAITPSGWIYATWQGADNHPRVSLLRGITSSTWSAPVDLGSSLGLTASVFHTAVAGDDDRAAVAFLGTTGTGNPFASGFQGTWDLYVSLTDDAGATWTTVKATTDPVQRGWICAGGVGCGGGRNLLDFMDVTLDAQGHVLVGYADGCTGACAAPTGTIASSTSAKATIARQSAGTCLYAASACGAASGTPGSSGACGSPVVLYSSPSAIAVSADWRGYGCSMGQDTAFVLPGSDRVQVYVAADFGTPTTTAVLDGLGLSSQTVTLTRAVSGSGVVTYTSARIPIDPLAVGSITATVYAGSTPYASATYHTVV